MKRFAFISLFLLSFSMISFAQIRIEKRHYTKGWYISLNDHKKKKSKTVEEIQPVSVEKSFTEKDTVPEFSEIPVMDSAASFHSRDHSPMMQKPLAAVKKYKAITEKAKAPVVKELKKITRAVPAGKTIVRSVKGKSKARSLYGDNDMWGIFLKAMLWTLICMAIIVVLVAIGQVILYSLFPAATIETVVNFIGVGILIVFILGAFFYWLYEKILIWWQDRKNKPE